MKWWDTYQCGYTGHHVETAHLVSKYSYDTYESMWNTVKTKNLKEKILKTDEWFKGKVAPKYQTIM